MNMIEHFALTRVLKIFISPMIKPIVSLPDLHYHIDDLHFHLN